MRCACTVHATRPPYAYRTLGQNARPTPTAQWLITLLELQPRQSEAVALAHHRLSRTPEQIPILPLTGPPAAPQAGLSAAPEATKNELKSVRSTA